jgi:hypothetical protein
MEAAVSAAVYAQLSSGDFWKRACCDLKRQDFDRSPSMATALLQKKRIGTKTANLGDFWKGLARTYEMLKTSLVVPP